MRTTLWRTITASDARQFPFESSEPDASARGCRWPSLTRRALKGRTTDERQAPERFERAVRRGRRGAHLNDRGDTRPARVSGGWRGGRGRRLAGADPDRCVAAAAGAIVLHPVRAAARLPREHRSYLARGRVRDRLLDVEIDLSEKGV